MAYFSELRKGEVRLTPVLCHQDRDSLACARTRVFGSERTNPRVQHHGDATPRHRPRSYLLSIRAIPHHETNGQRPVSSYTARLSSWANAFGSPGVIWRGIIPFLNIKT